MLHESLVVHFIVGKYSTGCVDLLLSVDRHLGFRFLAVPRAAAVNVHMQVFAGTHPSFLLGYYVGAGWLDHVCAHI